MPSTHLYSSDGIGDFESLCCIYPLLCLAATASDCGSVTISANTPPPIWLCTTGTVSRLNYGNNEDMEGIIAPTGAVSVTLTFTAFETELAFDKLSVLSCVTSNCTQTSVLLNAYNGSVIPAPVTSSTGILLVVWHSDASSTRSGWSATWNVGGKLAVFFHTFSFLVSLLVPSLAAGQLFSFFLHHSSPRSF